MAAPDDDLYDEGWADTTTTDVILKAACIVAGVLGAAVTALGWLATARWHLNRTSKGHRP